MLGCRDLIPVDWQMHVASCHDLRPVDWQMHVASCASMSMRAATQFSSLVQTLLRTCIKEIVAGLQDLVTLSLPALLLRLSSASRLSLLFCVLLQSPDLPLHS